MYSPENLLLAQNIRVIFLDVDGVFTDGRLLYSEKNESLKQFNVLDGQGIKLIQKIGIVPVIISGRVGEHVKNRLVDLGVKHIYLGAERKVSVAEKILQELQLNWTQAACMGDDWPDLQMIVKAAFSCAPQNGHREVLSRVDYVTLKKGGEGALREFCDLLLTAKGKYLDLLNEALNES